MIQPELCPYLSNNKDVEAESRNKAGFRLTSLQATAGQRALFSMAWILQMLNSQYFYVVVLEEIQFLS